MSSRTAFLRFLVSNITLPCRGPISVESCIRAGAHPKDAKSWQMRGIPRRTIFYRGLLEQFHYTTSAEDKKTTICWKCGKPIASAYMKFICNHCKAVQPPSNNMTYFEMLDVPHTFDVDLSTLQKNFKDLQRLFHPDKFSLSDDAEKEISATSSSLVNKAYNTLLTPLGRGIYMLELQGVFLGEETQLDDPEFLAEVMGLNEEISEAEDDDKLREIWHEVTQTSKDLVAKILDAFRGEDNDTAKSLLIKLRYYENITQKLKEMLPPS